MALEISEIHEVTDEFAEAINRLLPQLSPSHTCLNQEALVQIVASSGCTVFVARETAPDQSQIVGTVSLITFHAITGIRARIEDLVVDKAMRGRGVGEALMRAALTRASARHAKTVDLTCRASRSHANHLYSRMGFHLRETNVYRYDLRHTRSKP